MGEKRTNYAQRVAATDAVKTPVYVRGLSSIRNALETREDRRTGTSVQGMMLARGSRAYLGLRRRERDAAKQMRREARAKMRAERQSPVAVRSRRISAGVASRSERVQAIWDQLAIQPQAYK